MWACVERRARRCTGNGSSTPITTARGATVPAATVPEKSETAGPGLVLDHGDHVRIREEEGENRAKVGGQDEEYTLHLLKLVEDAAE